MITNYQNTKWISSAGGPLLLVSKRYAPNWNGVTDEALDRIATDLRPAPWQELSDYERACEIHDYIGVIQVGTGEAIVLSDEPMMTTMLSPDAPDRDYGLIVRWMYAPSYEEALASLSNLNSLNWDESKFDFHVDNGFVLFDSAYAYREIEESLTLPLKSGNYSVETCVFEPSQQVCLVLHRFVAY